MGVVVLILLAAIWAAFLLPPILRARAENRPAGSISDFRRQLRTLARTSPTVAPLRPLGSLSALPSASAARRPMTMAGPRHTRPVGLARSRKAVKRRRDVFVGLLVAMAGSLVLGFLPQLRVLWAVHLLLDVCFAGYVALLVWMRNAAAERDMKVRFLPTAAPQAEPALVYRRSGS